MRKTFEAIQAWRRTHGGRYPDQLADLKRAGFLSSADGICPEVLAEATRADPTHGLATSRGVGRDPAGVYEYELSAKVLKSDFEKAWLPADCPVYTRQDLKIELLKRPFGEQVPILRCSSHRAAAPAEIVERSSPWRNLTFEGATYWSGDFWEQNWLKDVPYCGREVNVLFGLKGPPFYSGRASTVAHALDLHSWTCAFGDDPWWWTYPYFDEASNRQKAPQLQPFFQGAHGRALHLGDEQWWIDGLVQLQGRILSDPKKVYQEPGMLAFVWERESLPVHQKFATATWLQGTVWTAPAGEIAGWLVWHYSDGSVECAPLIYGHTTARFWGDLEQMERELSFPEPVWKHHQSREEVGKERWLRLYRQSWVNPWPDLTVSALDFISNRESHAAPFIVAVNLMP